jgi:hypothetical protein
MWISECVGVYLCVCVCMCACMWVCRCMSLCVCICACVCALPSAAKSCSTIIVLAAKICVSDLVVVKIFNALS